ncbi:Uma2 family endonuclease [Alkalinema pantanalense CENA528]|uniref:Uma2 family endonuclease n=1 Tax=Alkalinema pantanalense TaxID=1620705 RepID=UPI003D701929
MSTATIPGLSLEEFLALPETKPASEFLNGEIVQKPMPKGKHSRLQLKLCDCINDYAEAGQIAYAFPELRCSFGSRSLVPDVAVFRWERIPFDADGEVPNDFRLVPDWVVEILSPDQSSNRVIGNILYCLEQGCQLGWLIDPADRSILDFKAGQQPILLRGEDCPSVLPPLSLALTVNQVFSWLKMANA